jgi:hypothetical protein
METPSVWTAVARTSALAKISVVLAVASILLFTLVIVGLHERNMRGSEICRFIETFSFFGIIFVSPLFEIVSVICGGVGIFKSILFGGFLYLLSQMSFGN